MDDPHSHRSPSAPQREDVPPIRDPSEELTQAGHQFDTDGNPSAGPSRTVQFRQYEVLRELGRGGMGVVFLARQRSLNRLVAIKTILAGHLSTPQVRQRFLREAEVLAKLQHPNIVRVYDLGEEDGQTYFVMEYVDGSDLAQASPLPPRQAAEIVEKVARAIHAAHQQGIVHRDLKPANVLHGLDGIPKVTDFGLAGFTEQDAAGHPLTLNDQLLGTAPYMAPEQAAGDTDRMGPATDIYGLGAVLYHVLSGQAPFLGKSTLEVLKRVQTEEPWPLRRLTAGIPGDLDTICHKCLDKEPQRRYATAELLADDLRRFVQGEPIQARAASSIHRVIRVARRSPLAQVALVLLALAAGFAGLRAREYDLYQRPHHEYFGEVVLTRDGILGLHPLDRSAVAKRASSLRFERRGRRGPILAVTALNSAGQPVNHTSLSPIGDSILNDATIARVEFIHDEAGTISKVKGIDAALKERWTFIFTDPPRTGYYVDSRGYEFAPRGSGAAYLEFDYTDQGWFERIRFFDRRGRPQPEADGAYALAFTHDDRGRTTGMTYLDGDDRPTLVHGYASLRSEWDDHDQIRRITFWDAEGKPTRTTRGVGSVSLDYDDHGNVTEIGAWGLDGQRTLFFEGYSRQKSTFDPKGFETARQFLDVDGNPVASGGGVAEIRYRRNEVGQVIGESNHDPEGRPIAGESGFARVDRQFDENGYITEESVFDVDGMPTVDEDGVFRSTYRYDDHGNRIEIAEFDFDGQPMINTQGWHRTRSVFDRHDNLAEVHYEDEQGRPVMHSNGMASVLYEYDDRGNIERQVALGIEGTPEETSDGYAEERFRYNERGQQIEQAVFDRNGRPTVTNAGWHRTIRVYDDRGHELEQRFFAPDGSMTWHADGYAIQRNTVDDHGNRLALAYLDPQEQPTMTAYGFSRATASYDHRGNALDARFFDTQDRPVGPSEKYWAGSQATPFLGLAGVHRVSAEYDHRGNLTRMRFFGSHLGPMTLANGVAGADCEYDHRGLQTRSTYVGIDGQPVELDGIATTTTAYDAQGHEIDVRTFDAKGRPSRNSNGFHQIVSHYDQRGNLVEFRLFDENGKPATHPEGHSWLSREYDLSGNLIKENLFDQKDRPVLGNRGYAMFTAEYDRFGNRIEEAYFDTEGKPRVGNAGYHRFRSRFERGMVVETNYYGADGHPIPSAGGAARIENRYDDQLRLIESATFDVDGQPVEIGGYARVQYERDPRGNVIRVSFLNGQGNPTSNDDGFARVTFAYDDLGRCSDRATYAADGNPVAGPDLGFFRETIKFDPRGNETHHRYLGVDEKPIRIADGYAEVTTQYDDRGQPRGRQYYDEHGDRLTIQVAVESVPRAIWAPETSLQVGDIVVRVDHEPISDAFHLKSILEPTASIPRTFVVVRQEQRHELQVPPDRYQAAEFQDILPGQPLPKTPSLLDTLQGVMQQ